MPVAPASQLELIPGYRLLTRLGQGGFGEVWKAEAPGGLFKAIKIVHGSIHGFEDADAPARQELKALERVKSVRHPFILSLERYDIVNGQLVIVTELADKNLAQRMQECRAQRLPGIPYEELMRYMEEAAEALDLMNIEYQLQHLDIKPQNLFLTHNHIKVADFGLVKELEDRRAQMTSGITAGYAAPETFEGLVSPYCDQYSLAIVYQELLTGKLPFGGTNPRQLMMQHVAEPPNLEPLPSSDRAAIGRALEKNPDKRYPSCAALVQALRAGRLGTTPTPADLPEKGLAKDLLSTPGGLAQENPEGSTVYLGPVRSTPALIVPAVNPPEPEPDRTPAWTEVPEPEVPEPPEITGDGLLFPALVIGLGGTGAAVLRSLRKVISKRWGVDGFPQVRFLLLDADPDELLQATQGDADTALRREETLLARLQRPSQYLKPGRELQELEKWLDPELLRRLPRDQTTPQGWRALGRLAFSGNATAILTRLRSELSCCTQEGALAEAGKQTGLGVRSNRPRVYVVGSPGGGTGGGMLLDMAYAARHLLRQLGYRQPEVQAILLLPAVERAGEKARATANTYAALAEVNYFAAAERIFPASRLDQRRRLEAAAPFSRCLLLPVPRGEGTAPLQETATLTGEFLIRELAAPLARVADEERRRRAPSVGAGQVYQTFGAYWFAVPRRVLLRRVARSLCQRLVKGWRAEHARGLEKRVQDWISGQLAQAHLTPEELTSALLQQAACFFEEHPEKEVEAILAAWDQNNPQGENGAEIKATLETLYGSPANKVENTRTELGEMLKQAASALGEHLEECLPELALRALAEPHFRLLGVEETVQVQLGSTLADLARTHRAAANEVARQAAALGPRILAVLEEVNRGSFWGLRKRNRGAAELLELLRSYAQGRWQAMLQHSLSLVYQDLHNNLQKYQRKVECCRKRLTCFIEGLESGPGKAQVDLGLGQYLLPAGCRSLEAACDQILASLGEQELLEIDRRVQELIGGALEAHVHVCTAPATFFKDLEEEVLREVTAFAEEPLGRAHAAEMYLAQRGKDERALQELAGVFDQAAPELGGSQLRAEDELNILAVPPGPEGEHFRHLVHQALPDQSLVPSSSSEDIVFYREVLRLPVTALPQMGEAAARVYGQFLTSDAFTPHSRTDISDWLTPPRSSL
jgi:serine/threonine protein kinase